MARIVFSIGHIGRPSKIGDRGAVAGDLEEAALAVRYAMAMDRELRRRGLESVPLLGGEYAEHWARADALGAAAYLNLHVNAGGGDRGHAFYDHRSARGKALGEAVCASLGAAMGWPCSALACRPDTNGVPRDGDYAEAFSTIRGVQAPALCLEPYFIDGPRSAAFVGGLEAVGVAVAAGIAGWLSRP